MLLISLDWVRPADGVEVVTALEAHPELAHLLDDIPRPAVLPDGETWPDPGAELVIRAKTPRTVPLALRVSSLEDPVSLRLANAKDIDALSNFVARFGALGLATERDFSMEESVNRLNWVRENVLKGLQLLNVNDEAARAEWSAELLADARLRLTLEYSPDEGRQKLALKADGLEDLILCEVAFAMESGAKQARCQHCDNVFLTGHSTGRRATATYCSDRCRVAAMRARNAREGR